MKKASFLFKLTLLLATLSASLLVAGCGDDGDSKRSGGGRDDNSKTSISIDLSVYGNDEASLEKLGQDLDGDGELLKAILPTDAEYAMIAATPEDAKKMADHLAGMMSALPPKGLGGRPEQTEILIQSGTTDEMKAGTEMDLPGGYKMTADHYRSGLTFYSISHVEPGKTIGMRFDAFIYVNDRWVFLPKIYRAFK